MSLKVCTDCAFSACVCVYLIVADLREDFGHLCHAVQALKKRMGRLGWHAALIQTDNKESDSSATVCSFEGLLPSMQIGCRLSDDVQGGYVIHYTK